MTVLLLLALGIAALLGGAELLVRGASRLASAAGVSSLVVGLTVVSFGTSAPELAVTVGSGLTGRPDVGVGNVVGSNILNILLILGLSAAIRPLVVSHGLVRREVPFLIGVSFLVVFLALDRSLGPWEGAALLLGSVIYTVAVIVASRRAGDRSTEETERDSRELERSDRAAGESSVDTPNRPPYRARDGAFVLVGLGLLLAGARWLVDAAVSVAAAVGVSEVVIGLTVVAVGTSLPEVATSVLAAARNERDIAVGNVVGSNILNLLLILGAGSVLTPGGLPVASSVLTFDMPIMIATAVACLPVFFTGYRIARWEGWLFLAYYAAYTLYLILAASSHDALDEYGFVMAYFVVPLTAITLLLLAVRAGRRRKGGAKRTS